MKTFRYPQQQREIEAAFSQTSEKGDELDRRVASIVDQVRQQGDASLTELTEKFDGIALTPEQFRLNPEVCREAWRRLDPVLKSAIEYAASGIRQFHQAQVRTGFTIRESGRELTQRILPLRSIGAYVPGGKASYPSTMLMNIIPAQVAGVKKIVVVSPPLKSDPADSVPLAVAAFLGVEENVYQVGGAQAVAALAYGTATIPRVDKVVGPGNQYVALAKKQLYGTIDIDSVAGNSEVMILADSSSYPAYIAADLLAQAEHTGDEQVILVGIGNFDFAAVEAELEKQLSNAPRAVQARSSLESGGIIVAVETREQAVEVANLKAPEHMEILTENPDELAELVDQVGAIFIGPYTPEPIGDYVAGPNHVLPTGGTARFFSPLGVDAFLKASNVLKFNEAAFRDAAPHTIALAECEGLSAHAESIRKRLQ